MHQEEQNTNRKTISTRSEEYEMCETIENGYLPVMAAVAVRKKVVSIGPFSPCFYLQSLKFFLSVRLKQKQLYVLIAVKIREK